MDVGSMETESSPTERAATQGARRMTHRRATARRLRRAALCGLPNRCFAPQAAVAELYVEFSATPLPSALPPQP